MLQEEAPDAEGTTPPQTEAKASFPARARKRIKQVLRGEEAGGLEADVEAATRAVLRSRLAVGIVALSILSSLAAWRASVFDEHAGNAGAVFQQEVVVQQQRERAHQASVARDLIQFGEFERHWFMASVLARDARVRGAGPDLSREAGREAVAAEQLLSGFRALSPTLQSAGGSGYDVAAAYRRDASVDIELAGLHPADALAESGRRRAQAVRMAGVAALFVAALVLLTVAQVMVRQRRPRTHLGPEDSDPRWSASHTLAVGGTSVGLLAGALFLLVMLQ